MCIRDRFKTIVDCALAIRTKKTKQNTEPTNKPINPGNSQADLSPQWFWETGILTEKSLFRKRPIFEKLDGLTYNFIVIVVIPERA